MPSPPLIFDRHLLRARRARAVALGPSTFLIERVAQDLADRLATVEATLSYTDVRRSLGYVDDEAGRRWSAVARTDYVNGTAFALARGVAFCQGVFCTER